MRVNRKRAVPGGRGPGMPGPYSAAYLVGGRRPRRPAWRHTLSGDCRAACPQAAAEVFVGGKLPGRRGRRPLQNKPCKRLHQQVHGRDEFLPYKLKIKAIQRRSCGPGMPGPYSSTFTPAQNPQLPAAPGLRPGRQQAAWTGSEWPFPACCGPCVRCRSWRRPRPACGQSR